MAEDIYPMPLYPLLSVRDLAASARFYEALGFRHIFTLPGPGGQAALAHLRWVKYADLVLVRPRDGQALPAVLGAGVTFGLNLFDRFDGDLDALAANARQIGAEVLGPVTQPWNAREVTVFDPDGYRLVFTAPIDTSLTFDEVIQQTTTSQANDAKPSQPV